mmetsp:Transcript_58424/g.127842  ORF Transcript_58424/g.127842 Transcript_58424/m.127842 type:complete len:118 (-) Transcript_58424:1516-1869(-)
MRAVGLVHVLLQLPLQRALPELLELGLLSRRAWASTSLAAWALLIKGTSFGLRAGSFHERRADPSTPISASGRRPFWECCEMAAERTDSPFWITGCLDDGHCSLVFGEHLFETARSS